MLHPFRLPIVTAQALDATVLQDFRERVKSACSRHPDMPGDLIVMTKLISMVYLRLEAAYDAQMAQWGLTAWSWFTLMVVYSRQGEEVTPSLISRSLVLGRANVTRVTEDLVRRGFLHRQASTRDRRVLQLSLTEAGTRLIHDTMPRMFDMHRNIWAQVSADQLAAAEPMLCGLLRGIESWPGLAQPLALTRESE